ncbi:MAG: Mut7-C RNAse domain-containing protein [Anaerolineae bacterium]
MNTRFIADVMLGKLARWLRILGNDTLYDTSLSDAELVRLARAQDRVLLTRDANLAKRTGARIMLITDDDLEEQLVQIMTILPINHPGVGRCSLCNTPLQVISKKDAWGNVPLYAFARHETFQWCRSCDAYYWPGSQWVRINSLIARVTARVDTLSNSEYNVCK